MKHATRDSLLAMEKQFDRVRPLLVSAFAACLLVSVALYNGYPTVFSDTGTYLLSGALSVAYPPVRAPGYSMFVILTSLGTSAWFIVLAQALIVVYVLRETWIYLLSGDKRFADVCLLGSVCGLAALTSLPWLVSLLMPDLFAGLVFLSAFLLAFAGSLRLIQRIVMAAIFTISVSTHMSFLPIALLFVPVLIILRFAGSRSSTALPAKSVLAWLLIPIVASSFFTAAMNRHLGLGFRVAPSTNDFLLARLFGDGLAGDFLREACPEQQFISCRDLNNLPRTETEFLFRKPLYHELTGHADEMDQIVRGAISAYPLRFLEDSAQETWLQITSIRTGDETRSYGGSSWNDWAIRAVLPHDLRAYFNSRQYRARLLSLADAVSPMDVKVFWLSAAACLLLAATGGIERVSKLFFAAVLFLLLNAAICATFSGVFDRYQSRVAWILPFCLTAYGFSWIHEWKRSSVREERAPADYAYDPTLAAGSEAYAGPGQVSFTSEVREES